MDVHERGLQRHRPIWRRRPAHAGEDEEWTTCSWRGDHYSNPIVRGPANGQAYAGCHIIGCCCYHTLHVSPEFVLLDHRILLSSIVEIHSHNIHWVHKDAVGRRPVVSSVVNLPCPTLAWQVEVRFLHTRCWLTTKVNNPCSANLHRWGLVTSELCDYEHQLTLSHYVNSRWMSVFDSGLMRLHEADDDAVDWLKNTAWTALAK